MAGDRDAAMRRVLGALDDGDALDALGTRVSGADLTTFLLEVVRRRSAQLSPADVLRRVRTDRPEQRGRSRPHQRTRAARSTSRCSRS